MVCVFEFVTISAIFIKFRFPEFHQWLVSEHSAALGDTETPQVTDTFWLAGIYFLVHAVFVASKLWIWQHFRKTQSKLLLVLRFACLCMVFYY